MSTRSILARLPHPMFFLFLFALAAGVIFFSTVFSLDGAVLLGFDLAAAFFIAATFLAFRGASTAQLRATAARDDACRILLSLTSAVMVIVILVLVGGELPSLRHAGTMRIALAVATLLLAWCFGNLICAVHYTHLFYDRAASGSDHAGLDFPGTERPDFADFCYFAFVIGMTFQVSDVQIESARIRRFATVHSVVAFLFNIGIVAVTVNIVAGAT